MNITPRLLLVEDDPTLQRMYDLAFTKGGFNVVTSPDGTIVYETASVNPPDIIVLDIMMPNYTACWRSRSLNRIYVPVAYQLLCYLQITIRRLSMKPYS